MHSWITDYITWRERKVVVNADKSQNISVKSCRSIEGISAHPLVFLIYVDGLTRLPLLVGGHIVLYADDLLLFHAIQNQEDYH